jgi:hypothetical protein
MQEKLLTGKNLPVYIVENSWSIFPVAWPKKKSYTDSALLDISPG